MTWWTVQIEGPNAERTETFERATSQESADRQAAEWIKANAPDWKITR